MDPNEFDLAKFREDFEQTYEEPEDETPEDENLESEEEELDEAEPEEDEPSDEDSEDLEDEEDSDLEEDEEADELPDFVPPAPKQKKQTKEENAAFAKLRRENEELRQKAEQASIVEQLAAQYGMSVDQFQAEYTRLQEENAAKQQGIPVDILRKMNQQDAALKKIQTESANEKFWGQVDKVKSTYSLEDSEVDAVFRYIGERGLIDPETKLPIIEFDVAYKAANFDKIQERKTKEAHQKRLADKKKRQTTSAKPHNSNASAAPSDDVMTDQQVEERLRAKGYI